MTTEAGRQPWKLRPIAIIAIIVAVVWTPAVVAAAMLVSGHVE